MLSCELRKASSDTAPVIDVGFALFFSPLTKVKLINELNEREASLGVNENVSWHNVYKDSAWIFIGKKIEYPIF